MNRNLLLLVILILSLAGCKKVSLSEETALASQPYVDSVRNFIEHHLSSSDVGKFDLAKIEIFEYKGQKLASRVFEKGTDSKRFLFVKTMHRTVSGHFVDLSSLSQGAPGIYSGDIKLTSLAHEWLQTIFVKQNKVSSVDAGVNLTARNATHSAAEAGDLHNANTDLSTPDDPEELQGVVVTPPKKSNPTISLYWVSWEDEEFSHKLVPIEADAGGGGAGQSIGIESAMPVLAPKQPISNIQKELGCFTVNQNATYKVSVNVNAPAPNTREISDIFVDLKAGHTFLTLQENMPDGSSIVRNVGFYPARDVSLSNTMMSSAFGEDSETPFCVSLAVTLSPSDFITLISAVKTYSAQNYDLYNFNCTNAAIAAFLSIGVKLPSTKSTSMLFNGNSPADLAEDIRALDINQFSASNGSRPVTRQLNNKNSLQAPAKKGTCQ